MKPVPMGTCPLCRQPIDSNQRTAWLRIDGTPTRVHQGCRP